MAELCRHCQQKTANRPRGLCGSCYYAPGRRDQYPSTSKHGREGVGAKIAGGHRLAALATSAAPGSEAKLCVLESRAYQGVALFHPCDAPIDLT